MKKMKTDQLQLRVSTPFKETIDKYVDATDTTLSEFARTAMREYMQNHPIKQTLFAPEIKQDE